MSKSKPGPKILVLDIETSPIESYTWGIFDQNVGLNQIKEDWTVIAWGAKWYDPNDSHVIYEDNRNSKNVRDDRKLLKGIWELLDKADIVVTQNGKAFDIKKLNARFAIHGMKPTSVFRQIDTLLLAKKYFGFTSNKLEYMADKINKKYKKLKHEKFPGFELWRECLNGNPKAWKEMEKYNKYDVLSLEELYMHLIPWDHSINVNIYTDNTDIVCSCGSTDFHKNGFWYLGGGKYQRYKCSKCGADTRERSNLLSNQKRKSIRVGIPR